MIKAHLSLHKEARGAVELSEKIGVALGQRPADILITNGRILDVFSGKVREDAVAVAGSRIVGLGDRSAKTVIDAAGSYVIPGFIDPHVHIESSMLCVTEFARAVVPRGTTTVVADPHEIANVLGTEGIRYMLRSSRHQPLSVYFTLPSCVPATSMETSGATIRAQDLAPFFNDRWVLGLGEMMNFPGVLAGDATVLEKIRAARHHGRRVEGHAPGLTGRQLDAYCAAGITSDHECTTAQEAREKLEKGMFVMVREGTGAKNIEDLLDVVRPENSGRLMWCTDDRHPHDIVDLGHVDAIVRKAIGLGVDVVTAVRMGTINPAVYFGLRDLGAVAPGYRADLLLVDDLHDLQVRTVVRGGVVAACDGQMVEGIDPPAPTPIAPSMNVRAGSLDFSMVAAGRRVRVIEVVPGQILTRQGIYEAPRCGGSVISAPSRDLLKIGVVERHFSTGNVGKGLVRGFGLRKGALASSVAHDSHNIIVVGVSDTDMRAACETVAAMGGGLAVACDGAAVATLPLPVAGLMAYEPVHTVRKAMDGLLKAAHGMGCVLEDPFMTLSFLALPVIPELKLTDRGLVDVAAFAHVPLFVD